MYFINPFGVKTEKIRPRLTGYDIYKIPSKSMQPLLVPGDYISVSNTAYLDDLPKRNDVIIFYKPNSNQNNSRIPYIKRVLAIAGDSIEISEGTILVNNVLIDDDYVLTENSKTPYSQEMTTTIIPENHVFVLGDNRDNSSDSRLYGSVAVKDVLAKATSIVFGVNERSGKVIK